MQKKIVIILAISCAIVLILFLLTVWRERQIWEQEGKEVVTEDGGWPEDNGGIVEIFMDEPRPDGNDGTGQTAPKPPTQQQIQEASLTLLGKSYLVQLGMTQAGANNVETEVIKKVLAMDLDYTAIVTVSLQTIQMEQAENNAQFQVVVSDSRELASTADNAGQPIQTAAAQTYQVRVQFVPGSSDIESFDWGERIE